MRLGWGQARTTREKAVESTHPGVGTKELQQQYQARDPTRDGSIALIQVVEGRSGRKQRIEAGRG